MDFWQHIYSHFNPVAFNIFGFYVHWYGIMYALALFIGLYMAYYFAKKEEVDKSIIDEYFVWAEIGIILGARI